MYLLLMRWLLAPKLLNNKMKIAAYVGHGSNDESMRAATQGDRKPVILIHNIELSRIKICIPDRLIEGVREFLEHLPSSWL